MLKNVFQETYDHNLEQVLILKESLKNSLRETLTPRGGYKARTMPPISLKFTFSSLSFKINFSLLAC